MTEFIPIVKDFGFPAIVALWLLWRLDSKVVPAVEALVESCRQNAEHLKALTTQLTDATKAANADHTDLAGLIDGATQAAHEAANHAKKAEQAATHAAASADRLYGLVHGALSLEQVVPATRAEVTDTAA